MIQRGETVIGPPEHKAREKEGDAIKRGQFQKGGSEKKAEKSLVGDQKTC